MKNRERAANIALAGVYQSNCSLFLFFKLIYSIDFVRNIWTLQKYVVVKGVGYQCPKTASSGVPLMDGGLVPGLVKVHVSCLDTWLSKKKKLCGGKGCWVPSGGALRPLQVGSHWWTVGMVPRIKVTRTPGYKKKEKRCLSLGATCLDNHSCLCSKHCQNI